MVAKLKLVHDASKVSHPRPFQTYYFSAVADEYTGWDRRSRAATPIGAIRAAVGNILLGKFKAADIYGEDSVRRYRLRLERNKLVITGYFGPLKEITE